MATKHQFITGLYESTIKQATQSAAAWAAFLRSACRNYKLRFDEQILVYAQRPDATAVLEIENWNGLFGRWVNKYAKGIAVFDDEHNGKTRLKHYFDVSDTHGSRFERPVPIWQMKPEYETGVIETLENSFGGLDDKDTLAEALISAAKNAVEDNMGDYLRELMYIREDSFLEELDELNVGAEYRITLRNSVAYMLMTRCGIDAREYFEADDFRYILDFNTRDTVNALGIAAGDISEMCLREIAATVRNLQLWEREQNRTFAKPESPAYDELNRTNNEGSVEHGTDIPKVGRLPSAGSGRAGGRTGSPWQIRIAPKEIPEAEPQSVIPELPDLGNAERTSHGDRADGQREDGTDYPADGGGAGRDGGTESHGSDGLGRTDEQHTAQRGGDDTEGPDLRIKSLPTVTQQLNMFGEAEETAQAAPSAFSVSQQIIDETLTSGGNEPGSVLRIAAYFKKDRNLADNAGFLRQEYRIGGKGFIFGGNHVSVWFNGNGLRIAYGDTVRSPGTALITWEQAAQRIRELLNTGRYMPQSELDKADGAELKELADHIWYTRHDLSDGTEFSFLDQEIWKGGRPDSTARIAELLAKPEEREVIFAGLAAFAAAYEQDHSLLRFRFAADHMRSALSLLEDLQREPLTFTADESISAARPGFITQDEIDHVLAGGENNENGKYRIYSYFLQDHTAKEKADFLKEEYGTGGTGRTGFDENHDSNGIVYSRENNRLPYDKVILSWPKAAKRIDELMAEGRYMSEAQLKYIPEYEKDILSGEIFSFFPRGPEEVLRPFPLGTDYHEGKKIIRPQLDEPERVRAILEQMAAVLDNTADFDRNYDLMQKAFADLTAYQNGTFSMFMPKAVNRAVIPAAPGKKETRQQPAAPGKPTEQTPSALPLSVPAVRETAGYDLHLGATVYLGIEEFEIASFSDTLVVLRDPNAPLFTQEMPRAGFDRRLRENRLNDGLIKAAAPEPDQTETEPPFAQYQRFLTELTEDLRRSDLYSSLRDRNTAAFEAEGMIAEWIGTAARSGNYPGLREAFELAQFRGWLIEDIFERTYQDISDGKTGPERRSDAESPGWVKSAQTKESEPPRQEIRRTAENGLEYDKNQADAHLQSMADTAANKEYTPPDEQEPTGQRIPIPGDRYGIQGRFFVVDQVDADAGTVSLRDVTFESGTGFPIFRRESMDFIRMYDPVQEPEPPQAASLQKGESGINYPGEIIPAEHRIPRYTVRRVVYADVISSNPPRADIADKNHAYGIRDGKTDRYLTNGDETYVVFDTYAEADAHANQLNAAEAELAPAWKKPKPRNRMQTFDPHPEIPMSERTNFRVTDDDPGAGGQKTKYRNNIEALRTLQAIEPENRFAAPEEQEILSRYVGWGGLAQAFDENNPQWKNEYAELKALLTPEEYSSARASTLNAHYTSPAVIKAIYKAVENMGFRTGNVLEPSCGTGNFFGFVPESMSESKLFGVELDGVTGRIARQLYQKNSIAVQGFETTELPDSFFDLAVGNVPFGGYSVPDKRYDKHKFHIHDYFFAKTLDKVRPGGIVAFVTSMFTMDKRDSSVRKYIAQRAELLGAIRLPNNAFKAIAGTEVTTDIIFLQKRDRIVDIEPDWIHLGKTEAGVPVNNYYTEHPGMILGEMAFDNRMYGNKSETSCEPFPDASLAEQLAEAVTNIHGAITEYERGDDDPEEDNSIPADPDVRNFSYTIASGQIYYRQDSRMVPVELPVTAQNRIRGLIELRECVRTLILYQTEDYPDSDIRAEQAKLNRLYDRFAKKYGLISSRGNSMAFGQDSAYPLLCSLEIIDENGELESKAAMFTKRTIKAYVPVTRADTASEALAVSLSEKARVDLAFMAELTGMSGDAIVKELEGVIFLNIGGAMTQEQTYVTAGEYLSGDVREKLTLAKAAAATVPALEVNIRALEAALPEELTAAEIAVRLGAAWIPPEDYQQFMTELLQTSVYAHERIKVRYSPQLGEWSIAEKNADRSNIYAYSTFGTARANAYRIIEDSLNLRDVRIFDTVYDADGNKKSVLNKKETAVAQGKQEIIRAKFAEWVWKNPGRRERLCRIYNDRFNSIRPRVYDGSHLTFPGMNPEIRLRKHQSDAIAHILYGGNTLLAHEVGAGKTFEMVAAAMEAKRLGLCGKSLFVVPNHITEQWASEFLQLYPSANILVATKKDFETKNRRKFCARIATGDFDAVIIGHSQFEKIPVSAKRQQKMLETQIDELTDGIEEAKRGKGERHTVKQMEKLRKSIYNKLAKLNDQSRKDDVVTFEELGIDRLYIDESHYFKNLCLITKMRNVAGISQTEAQKSSDLFMKTQYLDELTGGRGVIFATGTPISNSMVEMYTVQRFLQYKDLIRMGLQHFDEWAGTFGETVTAIELAPEGTGYRAKTRFAKFYNLPELMSVFRMAADIQTADMLNLPVPEANFHTVVLKPSGFQKDMIAELAERAEHIRSGNVDPRSDNMLKVTNDGRKLALDQRIINPMLPDDPEGKTAACADNIFDIWARTAAGRLTQIVFCDLSIPGNNRPAEFTEDTPGHFSMGGFQNIYDDIRQKLVLKGVPEHEIAFIHTADTEMKKKELFAKVRRGQIRVLMGSTQKMGAGTNVQDRLIALHDLDCPWRPSDLAQRLGRIVRQGNKNPEVEIFRYVTEGTFDSYLYQLVENKQKFIAQIMTSKTPVRVAEDVDEQALSYAEIKALATGNPLIIEKAQLDSDVNKLSILRAGHLSQKYALEDKILKEYPQEIKQLTELIAGYTADIQTLEQNTPADKDTFPPMKIGGILYAEKAEAGKAVIEACKAMTSPVPVPLGGYRGFKMILAYDSYAKEYRVTLSGALSHTVALGSDIHGNITRLDNRLERFAADLGIEEKELAEVRTRLEAAKGEVDRPFPQEQEFTEKSARLKELNILLNMDGKDHELIDFEPDEGDTEPERKTPERER